MHKVQVQVSKLVIISGPPCAGKTTLANALADRSYNKMSSDFNGFNNDSIVFHLDYGFPDFNDDAIRKKITANSNIIFEGIFLDESAVIDLVKRMQTICRRILGLQFIHVNRSHLELQKAYQIRNGNGASYVKVNTYDPNYQNVLNDLLTHNNCNTFTSVKYCRYNAPTEQEIKVQEIPEQYRDYENNNIVFGFNTGGSGTDWRDNHFDVDATEQSEINDYLEYIDNYIEIKIPDISFVNYRKLKSECLSTVYVGRYDYYSNAESYQYVFDISKMKKFASDNRLNICE